MDKLDNVCRTESKLLSSLGLCARARALIIGTPMVIEALRKSGADKPRLVLEAALYRIYDRSVRSGSIMP